MLSDEERKTRQKRYDARRDPVVRAASRTAASFRRRQRRAENPEQYWYERQQSWKAQGIPVWEAHAALAAHDGTCELCGRTEPKGMGDWHVDHKDDTVRGVLCAGCNMLLGRIENIGLGPIIKYLTANREKETTQ